MWCAGEGAHRAVASDGDQDVRHLYFEIGGEVGGEAPLRQLIEARGGLEASHAPVLERPRDHGQALRRGERGLPAAGLRPGLLLAMIQH